MDAARGTNQIAAAGVIQNPCAVFLRFLDQIRPWRNCQWHVVVIVVADCQTRNITVKIVQGGGQRKGSERLVEVGITLGWCAIWHNVFDTAVAFAIHLSARVKRQDQQTGEIVVRRPTTVPENEPEKFTQNKTRFQVMATINVRICVHLCVCVYSNNHPFHEQWTMRFD